MSYEPIETIGASQPSSDCTPAAARLRPQEVPVRWPSTTWKADTYDSASWPPLDVSNSNEPTSTPSEARMVFARAMAAVPAGAGGTSPGVQSGAGAATPRQANGSLLGS